MKIGISNYYLDAYGLEEGAKRMKDHGFECIDFNFQNTETEYYSAREEDFLSNMMKIKKALSKNGIVVNQIHGPWRVPRDGSEDDRAERFGKMTKAMVMAKHLGAKYMAIHPLMPYGADSPENPEEVYRINKRFFEALAKVGAGLGVTVCLENMPFRSFPLSRTEDILKFIKDIDSPFLKVCFDTGHAHILGEDITNSIKILGDDLKILHVHDNDGQEDLHLPPYYGTIDWAEFAEALYDIGYGGVLSLETSPRIEAGESKEEKERELARYAKLIAG